MQWGDYIIIISILPICTLQCNYVILKIYVIHFNLCGVRMIQYDNRWTCKNANVLPLIDNAQQDDMLVQNNNGWFDSWRLQIL